MSLANVEIGDLAPDVVNCIIEIPKGSSNKYEIDMESGVVRLDRVLYSPLFYPYDYGFIPQTIYTDGDPLDLLVLISHPTFPGCVVEVRPIGILGMRDEKGRDDKVLAVATRDPRFSGIMSLEDLGEHTRKEIVHFFEVYKELEDKTVEVLGWEGAETAKELISRFRI
ncbi:MAG: Inorganic pyrophosphatase [Fimbriimonadales bacterium]|nr:MAG: inorganic diphosphatase [Armatimonadota bacterium]MBV6502483.1 Inorganic pyrophosphatase [Fimbriimonadales bacterium]MCE7898676.1 inorganic diphosphatase [Armatimonadetes bacterium ATM1]MDL1928031.1 inorganic diphosphatase [Fimbriimonadia bacterium ATM]MBC6968485.1 inorganic diphosphatase [Armatimonadota bacterium]